MYRELGQGVRTDSDPGFLCPKTYIILGSSLREMIQVYKYKIWYKIRFIQNDKHCDKLQTLQNHDTPK